MKRKELIAIALGFILSVPSQAVARPISPKEYFGFQPGDDYKLAGWDQIVSYFRLLGEASDRVQVAELGKSTQGRPFIMAIISAEENLKELDRLRSTWRRLADPAGVSEEEAARLAREGKVAVLITCSIHATEVGAAQMSPLLAYKLATAQGEDTLQILRHVVLLLVPSFNPDGLVMVKDWYDKYLETPYEGSWMPWLYHYYTGHDNNRDAFMLTQVESRLVNRVLYHDWFPQIYLDMHQMGNRHARLWVPPFYDPINPNVDPTIIREVSLVGQAIATDLQAEGKRGILNDAIFTAWWQGAFLQTAWWHNVVGLLTELASVRIASPIFQTKRDLKAGTKGLQEYRPQVNFPDPWPGGWWRLRDIVEYDLSAAFSVLRTASRRRKEFLLNMYRAARRAIERGRKEPPYAYVIPPEQHDPLEAADMVRILMLGGVKVHVAEAPFEADGIEYPAGTFVVLMAQPYRNYAKDLLEPQRYPDMRQYPGGPPLAPYDVAGWTLPYQMGVRAVEVSRPFRAQLRPLKETVWPEGGVKGSGRYVVLDPRSNWSFVVVNRLLKSGEAVYRALNRLDVGGSSLPPGAWLIRAGGGKRAQVDRWGRELHLKAWGLKRPPKEVLEVRPVRLGVYQPWTASMHEGWSRWVLEQYEFPYRNIHNEEIRAGELWKRWDVIYFPDIWAEGILKGREEGTVPPEYAKGIGPQGLMNLREFVQQGGTIVAMDASCELFLGDFGLPVVDALKKKKRDEFFCPGSILRMEYDVEHPLAFGMDSVSVAYFARSRGLKLIPSFKVKAEVVSRYPKKNLLMSGWLLGEKHLAERVGTVLVPVGKGKVILIGFDAINRAQAHVTFKVFFNSILLGRATEIRL